MSTNIIEDDVTTDHFSGVYITLESEDGTELLMKSFGYVPCFWSILLESRTLSFSVVKEEFKILLNKEMLENSLIMFRKKTSSFDHLKEYKIFFDWLSPLLDKGKIELTIRDPQWMLYELEVEEEEVLKTQGAQLITLLLNETNRFFPQLSKEPSYANYYGLYGKLCDKFQPQEYKEQYQLKKEKEKKEKIKIINDQLNDMYFILIIPSFIILLVSLLFLALLTGHTTTKLFEGGVVTIKSLASMIFLLMLGGGSGYYIFSQVQLIKKLHQKRKALKTL